MTDYIGITEAQSNPFAPLTSELVKQLRDNPIAIAEGAPGAPRINPIGAMTHNGAVGAVGTWAFLETSTGVNLNAGSTRAGSGLLYANAGGADASGSPSGTWRLMGRVRESLSSAPRTSVWLRIS